ncbi:hypothetical protein RSal33209_3029 [Renibacterium salmoninarum ATCC 33209]|uniref:Uncharacterized protein n=1 Tax=Renibacterium salmoninarum (strain ATCC 33209 / DSM 20767 / JCM 11484 / NBRC 15589 / NCIMB 2235) TaxID=288705 RepID=A9WU79_RENSM|nr:hypothetical protein RSal33209_3029 [Renibacterium salmoninarum ATCC 33209]
MRYRSSLQLAVAALAKYAVGIDLTMNLLNDELNDEDAP